MIRCRGMLLRRNRENVQGESATKGCVQDINPSQAFEQSGRNANVRKQEEEIVVRQKQRHTERERDRLREKEIETEET